MHALHRYERDRSRQRHADHAPPKPPAMQRLPLRREPLNRIEHAVLAQKRAGEQGLDLLATLEHGQAPRLRQRRHRLQAPFLVGYPLEDLVAPRRELLLPAGVALLPRDPGCVGAGDERVNVGLLAGGLLLEAFAVDEGAAGGDGEEEEAHRRLEESGERCHAGKEDSRRLLASLVAEEVDSRRERNSWTNISDVNGATHGSCRSGPNPGI